MMIITMVMLTAINGDDYGDGEDEDDDVNAEHEAMLLLHD